MRILPTLELKKSVPPKTRRFGGFTLIELLVVIAIIALLAAILFPVFARARENARKSSCQNNLKQIGIGMAQYSQDYDEMMTPMRWCHNCGAGPDPTQAAMPFHALILPYTKSVQIYKCPSYSTTTRLYGTPWPQENIPQITISYAANAGDESSANGTNATRPMANASSARSLADITYPASTIAVVEASNITNTDFYNIGSVANLRGHLGQSNLLFVDGHVKSMRPTATSEGRCMWTNSNSSSNGGAPGTCNAAWHTALVNVEATSAQFK